MDRYYPVFLRIKNRACIVIGGGNVATRKTLTLLQDGGIVTVISPVINEELHKLANDGRVTWKQRQYQRGDLQAAFLAFAATNSKEVNRQVCSEAEQQGVLVNSIDDSDLCDFIVPSRVDRGKLQIAISTSGASPALTKSIRQELETIFGDEYELFLDWMHRLRVWLLENEQSEQRRREIFHAAVQSPVLSLLRENRINEAKAIIHELVQQEIL